MIAFVEVEPNEDEIRDYLRFHKPNWKQRAKQELYSLIAGLVVLLILKERAGILTSALIATGVSAAIISIGFFRRKRNDRKSELKQFFEMKQQLSKDRDRYGMQAIAIRSDGIWLRRGNLKPSFNSWKDCAEWLETDQIIAIYDLIVPKRLLDEQQISRLRRGLSLHNKMRKIDT